MNTKYKELYARKDPESFDIIIQSVLDVINILIDNVYDTVTVIPEV